MTQPHKKEMNRRVGVYVIDMCIPVTYNFLPREKRKREIKWVSVAGILRKER